MIKAGLHGWQWFEEFAKIHGGTNHRGFFGSWTWMWQ